jgi:hypothetical protein
MSFQSTQQICDACITYQLDWKFNSLKKNANLHNFMHEKTNKTRSKVFWLDVSFLMITWDSRKPYVLDCQMLRRVTCEHDNCPSFNIFVLIGPLDDKITLFNQFWIVKPKEIIHLEHWVLSL